MSEEVRTDRRPLPKDAKSPVQAASFYEREVARRSRDGGIEFGRSIPQTASRPAPFTQGSQTGGTANVVTEGLSAPAPVFDFGADEPTNAMLVQCAQSFLVGRVQQCLAAKHAHDMTAKCKDGVWGKWCAAIGISRDTGESLVRIADIFGNCELDGKPLIEALPIALLSAAAKPSAPPALVDKVKSGDIATHKAYQAALAESKEKDRKIERLERTVREKDKQLAAGASTQEQLRRRSAQYNEAAAERDAWKARAEELEARPVEVAVEIDEAEVERRATEKAQALADAMLRDRPNPADDPEQIAHDAYDAGLQFWRTIDNAWRLAAPRVRCLAPGDRQAIYQKCVEIFDKVRKDMT